MGRPKLNVSPTVIRLPHGVADRIDALVGNKKRSQFIREAVERELRRRELLALKRPESELD
jgi:predicted DNA-binding protein